MAKEQPVKTFLEELSELIDKHATRLNLDNKAISQYIKLNFDKAEAYYQDKLTQWENEQEQKAFDVEFQKRLKQYEDDCAKSDYRYKVTRDWQSKSSKHMVEVGRIKKSIFQEVK
jgi:hypothetical protein